MFVFSQHFSTNKKSLASSQLWRMTRKNWRNWRNWPARMVRKKTNLKLKLDDCWKSSKPKRLGLNLVRGPLRNWRVQLIIWLKSCFKRNLLTGTWVWSWTRLWTIWWDFKFWDNLIINIKKNYVNITFSICKISTLIFNSTRVFFVCFFVFIANILV